jgi:hypothetical protein
VNINASEIEVVAQFEYGCVPFAHRSEPARPDPSRRKGSLLGMTKNKLHHYELAAQSGGNQLM